MYSWRVRSSQMQGIKEATFYKCCCRPPSRMFSILIPPSTMISQLILENANEIIRDCTLKDLWIATSLMPPCFLFSGQCRVNLGLISLFLFQVYSNSGARSYKTIPLTNVHLLSHATMLLSKCLPDSRMSTYAVCTIWIFVFTFVARWMSSMDRLSLVTMLASLRNNSLHHASSCSVARLSMHGSVRLEGDCPILNALLGSHTNVL